MVEPAVSEMCYLVLPTFICDYLCCLFRVPNRIVRLDKYRIMAMVYAKHTNSAYIISDTMTASLLHGADMLDSNGHNLFYEIKYTISKYIYTQKHPSKIQSEDR